MGLQLHKDAMNKADLLFPEFELADDWATYAETLGDLSPAHLALEALSWHRASGLATPDWVLEAIDKAYDYFNAGIQDSGVTREQRTHTAPLSLGEAFGVSDLPKGTHLQKRSELAVATPRIYNAFFGPDRLSKTEKNYERIATELNLTPDQIRAVVRKGPPK